MKTKKVICASCRKKVDFIIREGYDTAHIFELKDGKGKIHHITYVRKYAYCKECGNEVYVPEVDDYNANAPFNNPYGKGETK